MERNKALVLGALGQDGSFMCDVLLENNFDVYGLVKENSDENRFNKNVFYIKENIDNIQSIISKIKPNHIYNFMGITDVFNPWENVLEIYQNNFLNPVKIIEAIRCVDINIKYLQASSSLIFGMTNETPQNEKTDCNPVYHYGLSKKFTDDFIKLNRKKFNMKLNSAILYSHESERRGGNFFSKKIINDALDIKIGKREFIEVGDVDGYRDIGYAKDYMQACFLIMSNNKCDDYVVGTGKSTKTIDFIKIVFDKLNLDINKNLLINDKFKRDIDLSHLVADNTKIINLGWRPTKTVEDIINIMINKKIIDRL
jgi:GDPmannose 4,6-dehydratase